MELTFDRSLEAVYGVDMRLSPRVSRVLAANPGPFTFQGTGVYLVGNGADVAVIDPGPDLPAHVAAIKRAIGTRRLSHILLTHTHMDHSPAAAPLKVWSGAKTYGVPLRALPDAGEGVADEAIDHGFVPDVVLGDGDVIAGDGFSLTCMATPGHTSNHMCYALAGEQALFSGDHVMGWATSVVAPPDGNMAQYLASLDRLLPRDDRVFYPTHGSPIAQPQAWVRGLIAHRHRREAQIVEALGTGDDSVTAIAARLYPDVPRGLRAAAASQVRAHLDHLVEKAEVAREGAAFRLV
jgi:glyoxylase-like metal-dependent hydrolase (beta-lactamase superfamily II)